MVCPLSTPHLEGVLTQHAEIARLLVDLYRARHDPELPVALRRQETARGETALATAPRRGYRAGLNLAGCITDN